MLLRKLSVPTFLLLSFLSLSFPAFAAPKADLWPFWQATQTRSTTTVDHAAWQHLLDHYLVVAPQQTRFRYAAVTTADKVVLNDYLDTLTAQDPRQLNRNEQFAYWVNLYNALTVKVILDNYPISSITKLGGFLSFGPWDEKLITIDGKQLSLNDIEHRILRPIWQDKRIHYVVNCASLGCPDLQPEAMNASNLNAQLEAAATRFINSPKGVQESGGKVRLSSIYDWYQSDFGALPDLQQHLNQYREQPVTLNKPVYDYDWRLNEAR
ncbi:DUF547 domain-containing protein [Photobacterium sp. 1_MG-2023]|uniref:DUF547 domain-containing protein n=1 Tax=Photobacterium sp. 1_MG-2023 TaxID=3062646 RepID=UPI0026E2A64A|nr:DUF547 domain-containing protein [Photobacterium sp. 1_MG-2023]MDO6707624.1 DUF547 domain-containing protein [Photobacterium sp. 1_MG-2023]